ncbi:hypothetical protein [Phage blackswan219-6]|nr:hypothetical protein [Phage blackswan219-6]
MLLKISEFPDELAEQLKGLTGANVASKAVLNASIMYPRLVLDLQDASCQIQECHDEIHRLRAIIEGARSAAALLLEKTGQGDLLADSDRLPFLRRVDVFED